MPRSYLFILCFTGTGWFSVSVLQILGWGGVRGVRAPACCWVLCEVPMVWKWDHSADGPPGKQACSPEFVPGHREGCAHLGGI